MSQTVTIEIDSLKSHKTVPCIRPWTSLEERSLNGDYKVCCWINTIFGRIEKTSNDDILTLWNNNTMTRIRRSFVDGTFVKYCPEDCPIFINQANYPDFYEYDPSEYNTFSQKFRSNREKIISSISRKKILMEAFPLRLKLHPSNTCNLNCRMCLQDKSLKQEVGKNYYNNVYKLMPYLEDLIIFGGEPFACRISREIIFGEEIKKYPHIHFSTITNGTLLDDKVLEKLKGLRLGQFYFSLDSCNEKTYENIRINASYARTFSNLKKFVRKRDNGEIRIRDIIASFTIQDNNYHEIREFIDFTNELKIQASFNFVEGFLELHDRIDEVRMSIEEGLARAKDLGDDSAAIELSFLLENLPRYEAKLKKLNFYHRIFTIVDRKRVVGFFERHDKIKKYVKKIIGL